MLGTSPCINPHSLRGFQVVPTGIGMDQRPLPLPVFGGTLGVDDQRIAFWSFENCIGFSGQVIRRFRVGKGETVCTVMMNFMLLSGRGNRIGKPMIHPKQPDPGNMGQ